MHPGEVSDDLTRSLESTDELKSSGRGDLPSSSWYLRTAPNSTIRYSLVLTWAKLSPRSDESLQQLNSQEIPLLLPCSVPQTSAEMLQGALQHL